MHQRLVRLHQIFKRNRFIQGTLRQRRSTTTDQKNHQREFVQVLKFSEYVTRSPDRLLRRQRMPSLEVREPAQIMRRFSRSHDHPFQPSTHLRNQRVRHRMRSLANGNREHPRVGV